MAFFEPPSFSLGLDLDFDSEPQISVPDCNTLKPASDLLDGSGTSFKEDDGVELETGFADCIADVDNDPPRKLKRLKRGPPEGSSLAKRKEPPPSVCVDDDIEEFSSQEDFPRDSQPSSHFRSVCSSSKVPLHGILNASTSSELKAKKKKQVLDVSTPVGLEKQNKSVFSNLTISPLRRFQLLESDSDDPSGCDNQTRPRHESVSSLNEKKSTSSGHSAKVHGEKKRPTASSTQKEDLWKDFCQPKSFHLQTPAFDAVCEENFRLKKNNEPATRLGSDTHISCRDNYMNNSSCLNKSCDELNCPAHYYYFHDDPRIQNLVRNRLPNFSPLGVDGSKASFIDYMRQFSNGEATTSQAPQQVNMENSSRKSNTSSRFRNVASKGPANKKAVSPKSSKKATKMTATQQNRTARSSRSTKTKLEGSMSEELQNDSGSWIDPKSSFSLPVDAGKRRIHAGDGSTGHWLTSPEGKKVYITKSGEELTGRTAYRCYKKDNGGFRKSKKKASGKKRKR